MSRRSFQRFSDQPRTQFADVHTFLSARTIPPGVLTIDYNGAPLDILNQPSKSKTTVVVFHTALSENMKTLPVFTGAGVMAGLDANVVSVSDPTLELDDSLKLAWFAGNERQPLQRDLPGILERILESHGAEHVIFFGASGGGFAALYYSACFPGSLALPLNPQTIIKNFPETAVLPYTKAAFGASTLNDARVVLADRVTGDLRHVYRGGRGNSVAYVQNSMDTHHLYRHMSHFLNAIPQSNQMYALVKNWGLGHVPPPKDFVGELLSSVVRCDGRWEACLGEYGFIQAPTADYPLRARESATA